MNGSAPTHPLFPIGRPWIISLSDTDRTVEAYDAETLQKILTGTYIAPKEFRKRDPRLWSDRLLMRLVNRYGVYGGTRLGSEVFLLAEVLCLRVLVKTASDADRKAITQMPLVEALQVSRDFYADYVMHRLSRENSNSEGEPML